MHGNALPLFRDEEAFVVIQRGHKRDTTGGGVIGSRGALSRALTGIRCCVGTVDTPTSTIIARARAMHVETALADVVDGLPLVLPMLPRRAVLESKVITQLTHVAVRARETRKRLRGQVTTSTRTRGSSV